MGQMINGENCCCVLRVNHQNAALMWADGSWLTAAHWSDWSHHVCSAFTSASVTEEFRGQQTWLLHFILMMQIWLQRNVLHVKFNLQTQNTDIDKENITFSQLTDWSLNYFSLKLIDESIKDISSSRDSVVSSVITTTIILTLWPPDLYFPDVWMNPINSYILTSAVRLQVLSWPQSINQEAPSSSTSCCWTPTTSTPVGSLRTAAGIWHDNWSDHDTVRPISSAAVIGRRVAMQPVSCAQGKALRVKTAALTVACCCIIIGSLCAERGELRSHAGRSRKLSF